jgi:subtilisin family serine protease
MEVSVDHRAVLLRAAARLILLLGSTAHAQDLPEPVRVHGMSVGYRADRLEIRLTPPVSSLVRESFKGRQESGSEPASNGPFGVAALDAVAERLGVVSIEPEFRGDVPPPPGSVTADLTAFYIAHLSPGADPRVAIEELRSLPQIASADPIPVLPVALVPDDSLWTASYWYFQPSRRDIHAPEAWEITTGDSAVLVAVLDTGVLPYHPDLGGGTAGWAGLIWTHTAEAQGMPGLDDDGNGFVDDAHGWDFVSLSSGFGVSAGEDWRDADNDPNDFNGHGTAVAGLIGGLSNNGIGIAGTAWDVRLMPLRIGWSTTSGGVVDMSYAAQAIRYATRMGASIINCSFATLNLSGLFEAVSAAVDAGLTIVSASGNNGQPHDLAARDDVIAVAASRSDDTVAPFSNLGSYVDLCAPGDDILSTFVSPLRPPGGDSVAVRQPAYATSLDGTSFAAPLVAGGVALMQARQRALGGGRSIRWRCCPGFAELPMTSHRRTPGSPATARAGSTCTGPSTSPRRRGSRNCPARPHRG